jgi:hypothetical protein
MKSGGPRGRFLVCDLPGLGFKKFDRVEPSDTLDDIASVDNAPTPFELTFWRNQSESMTRHRNPIFDYKTGVSQQSLGIDWLHTLSLGVMQVVLANLIWELVLANSWGVPGPLSAILDVSISRIRAELFEFYGVEDKAGRVYTRVQQFWPTMFGSNTDRQCKLHGSETNGFLNFARRVLLERYGHKLLHNRRIPYIVAIDSLLEIVGAIKAYPRRFPPHAIQQFVDNVCLHIQNIAKLKLPEKPKHHFLIEMGARPLSPHIWYFCVSCLDSLFVVVRLCFRFQLMGGQGGANKPNTLANPGFQGYLCTGVLGGPPAGSTKPQTCR